MESLLPIKYRDGHVLSAIYLISSAKARGAIGSSKLHPLALPRNCGVAVLSLFDYLDTSIGPYREFSIGVLATPVPSLPIVIVDALRGNAPVGAWILALPVTSPLACEGGIEIFGYPKTVQRIDVQFSNRTCSCVVHDGHDELVALTCPLRRGPRFPVNRLLTFTELNGQVMRTDIKTQWRPTISSGRGVRLRLGNQHCPIVAIAASLELPAEPIFLLHGSGFSATLQVGCPLVVHS